MFQRKFLYPSYQLKYGQLVKLLGPVLHRIATHTTTIDTGQLSYLLSVPIRFYGVYTSIGSI